MQTQKSVHKSPLILLTVFLTITVLVVYIDYLMGNKLLVFSDWGSDTKDSYMMYYGSIVNKLMAGDFNFYSFTMGMGTDILTAQSLVFDPFSLIVYIFTPLAGMGNIAHVMTIMQIVKIYCAGYACYLFLYALKISPRTRVITAYIYAFCGVMMQWGQLYIFASAIVLIPLLLYAVERSFSNKKFLVLLSAMVAVSLIFSIYFAYMFLIVAAFYALLRFFQRNTAPSFKLFKSQLVPIIGFAALGVLISFIVLLPSVNLMLFSSERLSDGSSFLEKLASNTFSLYSPDAYYGVLTRSVSNNLMGFGNTLIGDPNPYGHMQTFFSLLFLLVLPQYLINLFKRDLTKGQRASYVISVLLIGAMYFLPVASYVLNGFQYPNSRHTVVMMPFVAIVTAVGLKDIIVSKKLNKPALFITLGLCVGLILYAYHTVANTPGLSELDYYRNFFIMNLVLVGAMAALLFFIVRGLKAPIPTLLYLGLCVLVIINMTWDAKFTLDYRTNTTNQEVAGIFGSSISETIEDAKEREGNAFFRMEKTYSTLSPYEESGMQDYNGISMYSSLPNKYLLQFARHLWPSILSNDQFMYSLTVREQPVIEALSGMKYLVDTNNFYNSGAYETAAVHNDFMLLENKYANASAWLFPSVITEESFATLGAAQKDTVLTQAVIATRSGALANKYAYDLDDSGYTEEDIADYDSVRFLMPGEMKEEFITTGVIANIAGMADYAPGTLIYQQLPTQLTIALDNSAALLLPLDSVITEQEGKEWVLTFNMDSPGYNAVTISFLDEFGETLGSPASFVTKQGGSTQKQCKTVLPEDTASLQLLVESPTGELNLTDFVFATRNIPAFPESGIMLVQEKSDLITCEFEAAYSGVLYVPIPYQEGWEVLVDGQPADLLLLNYSFMGTEITPGSHRVEFRYAPPWFVPGVICTLIGIALVILGYLFYIRKPRLQTGTKALTETPAPHDSPENGGGQ